MKLPGLLDRAFGSDAPTMTLELASFPAGVRAKGTSLGATGVSGVDGSWYLDALHGSFDVGGYDDQPQLSGRNKYGVYREMRQGDPAIRSLEWLFKLPIRRAKWGIEPASDDPLDLIVADFYGWQFGLPVSAQGARKHGIGKLSQTWDSSISQALLSLAYGAQGEELVWADPEEWIDADGDTHLLIPLSRLAPRMASTIIRMDVDPRTGDIVTVEQDLPGTTPIPGDKLAWYVTEPEGAGKWGTSLLRPCYGPWLLKKGLSVAAAIGWDRFAAGTPLIRYPQGGGQAAKAEAERIGRNYRVHERGWVALEGAAGDGWDFEIKSGAQSLQDPTPLLRAYDHQIAMAGLQQFSNLGNTETGSRAVGAVLADAFYLAADAVAQELAQARMRQVMQRIHDLNFPKGVPLPTLTVMGIEPDDIERLGRVLYDLSQAGLSFDDPDTQNDIRDRISMRHLPDNVAEALRGLPDNVGVSALPPPPEGSTIAKPVSVSTKPNPLTAPPAAA